MGVKLRLLSYAIFPLKMTLNYVYQLLDHEVQQLPWLQTSVVSSNPGIHCGNDDVSTGWGKGVQNITAGNRSIHLHNVSMKYAPAVNKMSGQEMSVTCPQLKHVSDQGLRVTYPELKHFSGEELRVTCPQLKHMSDQKLRITCRGLQFEHVTGKERRVPCRAFQQSHTTPVCTPPGLQHGSGIPTVGGEVTGRRAQKDYVSTGHHRPGSGHKHVRAGNTTSVSENATIEGSQSLALSMLTFPEVLAPNISSGHGEDRRRSYPELRKKLDAVPIATISGNQRGYARCKQMNSWSVRGYIGSKDLWREPGHVMGATYDTAGARQRSSYTTNVHPQVDVHDVGYRRGDWEEGLFYSELSHLQATTSSTIHTSQCSSGRPFVCDESMTPRNDLKPLYNGERPHGTSLPEKQFSINDENFTREYGAHLRVQNEKLTLLSDTNKTNTHHHAHSSSEPCLCTVCCQSFTEKSQLESHLRTHTDEMPYQCAPGKMQFSSNCQLASHITSDHTSDTPYECSVCGQEFSTNNNLVTHLGSHNVNEKLLKLLGLEQGL